MLKVLIVGQGGRESSIAMRLSENASVYAVMAHENPTIAHYVRATGGGFLIGKPTDCEKISRFAAAHGIDLAFVSSDEPLAAGVVDSLQAAGIRTVGPTRAGAQIEWDKSYAMELMGRLFPDVTPKFWVVRSQDDLASAIAEIENAGMEIVVKPQGLTGGKGVKVMGAHLKDLPEAADYVRSLLAERPEESVILMEKVDGVEFTVMVLTDGVSIIGSPATYDYPYRFDGDTGPGTGGMGAFSSNTRPLPFMAQAHYDQCLEVAKGILRALREDGRQFSGVLNVGFFVTEKGLRFLEFNARFGDPECMNIMATLESPLLNLLTDMVERKLTDASARFSGQASVVKYLVAPEYALAPGKKHEFALDVKKIKAMGVHVFFSSAEKSEHGYVSVGNSRCVALAAQAPTIEEAAERIESAIAEGYTGDLQWRRDVGDPGYINALVRRCQ